MAVEKDGLLGASGGQRNRSVAVRAASGGQKLRGVKVYVATGGQRKLAWTANRSDGWAEALAAAESRGPLYRVLAGRADAAGLSGSYTQPTQADQPPDQVTGLLATSNAPDKVQLSWDAMARADTYEVRRDGVVVKTGLTVTSWEDTGRSASTTYCYEVRACNESGCGAWSAQDCATTQDDAPAAPTLNSASFQLGKKTVDLTWSNVTGEAGYNAYYRQQGASSWSLLGTAGADVTSKSFSNNSFAASTTYEFMVRAKNSSGVESSNSNVLSDTSDGAPSTPGSFSASWSTMQCKVTLTWTDVSTETGYRIEEDAGSGYAFLASPAQDATSYQTPTRSASTFYQYRIRAENDYGTSSWATTSITTGSCDGFE